LTLRSSIVSQFERPHGFWGSVAGWIMAHRPSNIRRNLWTLDLLEIEPDDHVLEIGCGPGIALQACAQRLRSGRVVGVDHSPTMLVQARRRNLKAIAQNRVALRHKGLTGLSEAPGSFTKIYSVNVVQFFSDRSASLRRMHDLTAPGGMVATTYQPRHNGATRNDGLRMATEIKNTMAEIGFADTQCHELPLEPVPAFCVLGIRPPSLSKPATTASDRQVAGPPHVNTMRTPAGTAGRETGPSR